ncbi:CPBP family glutamic-type intramembrane protease [Dyella acidiphila]|uniref:CPBP family intramembrane metalloprotease n=1 Tax=Dyella acidiphila TaxID=2775866 RepID=A0ABR9G5Y9_9GAMM|nr:CPBP family glutamic-type intramembrane protease [Dyella acidiphila]MBE1159469.1 CPBP family intramembrane metalloprotease [Dyella acidiphila]
MRNSRSITLYLAVAFGFAWAFWLLAWLASKKLISLPLVPMLFIGSFGPLIGAAVTTHREGGFQRMAGFFRRALDPRMGWSVFLVSFFLMPILAIVVELTHAQLTGKAPHFTMTLADFPLSYLFLFVLGGTLAEEYGWTLLSDELDVVLPLKSATAVLGAIWALWHLPLFFIVTKGAIQGYTPFYIFFIVTVAMRFLFAWAYHRGDRSILSNMLFHTASNIAYSLVAIAPAPGDLSTGRLWMFTLLTVISAVVTWAVAPPRTASQTLAAA